jgi:hypothetical protein
MLANRNGISIANSETGQATVFNIRGPSWRMREHHALADTTRDPDHDDTNGGGRRER